MTISYNVDIASSSSISFLKVVFRWRGSVWKSVFHELIGWSCIYAIISVIYRKVLTLEQQLVFAKVAHLINDQLSWLPLTFILAFFVTNVVERWKSMFHNVGFIDRPALVICHHISGDDEVSRILRRNLLRYLCLTQILVLRDTSMQVRRRFPTLQSVMDAGYLTKYELKLLLKESGEYHIYWVPINWVMLLVKKTRNNGKVVADVLYNNIASEIFKFYDHLMTLLNYDWVPVPLVYPQVVFLTVRIYFLLCLISRQYIINDEAPNKAKIDLYIPFMTLFEFLLQMGWLKVAEAIMNPMGEDDDDLELNYIIDRNITMAMEMTDPIPCPDATEDCFTNGIPYLYPEGTKRPRALVGSAQVKVAKSEEPVNMVPRKRYANTPINNEKIPQSNRSTCEIKVDNVRLARKRPHSQIPDSSELTSNMNDTTTYDGGDDGAGMV